MRISTLAVDFRGRRAQAKVVDATGLHDMERLDGDKGSAAEVSREFSAGDASLGM